MFDNSLFYGILLTTAILQALIVEFGSIAFKVHGDGLSAKYWGISLAFGAGSMPVQQIINVCFGLGQQYNISRNATRVQKVGRETTERVTNGSNSAIPIGHHKSE